MTKLTALAALALVAACGAESPEKEQARITAESDAARPMITQQWGRYVRGAAMGSADSILAVYADDAVLMPPNRPAISDRAAARAAFADMGSAAVTFATSSLTVTGSVAVERGIWQATMRMPGTTFVVARDGKYLAHWHKINGEWLMTEHIWNDDFKPMAK